MCIRDSSNIAQTGNVKPLPVISNIAQTGNVKPLCDVARADCGALLSCDRSAALMHNVASVTKSAPRLSRLNAIDLSVTGAASKSDVTTSAQPTPSLTGGYLDSCDVDRVIPRREIVPIPGAVCSAEEAARVGSSYLCSVCHKTFSSAPQLAVHHNIHYLDQQFRCGVCRASFASRASLEHHQSRKHHKEPESSAAGADPRPYKCDECGVAFRIQGHLDKHKRSKVHAARLETSQDLSSVDDVDRSSSGLPLRVSEMDVTAAEGDECQDTLNEFQQTDAGMIHLVAFCQSVTHKCVEFGETAQSFVQEGLPVTAMVHPCSSVIKHYNFLPAQYWSVMLCSWEGSRRSGVALVYAPFATVYKYCIIVRPQRLHAMHPVWAQRIPPYPCTSPFLHLLLYLLVFFTFPFSLSY